MERVDGDVSHDSVMLFLSERQYMLKDLWLQVKSTVRYSSEASIPVAFEVIRKPLRFCDLKMRQIKRASLVMKKELMREMIGTCVINTLKFCCVLMDSWFGSVGNFEFIVKKRSIVSPRSKTIAWSH